MFSGKHTKNLRTGRNRDKFYFDVNFINTQSLLFQSYICEVLLKQDGGLIHYTVTLGVYSFHSCWAQMLCGWFSVQRGHVRALYNTHSSGQFVVTTDNRKILQMSLISQTKVFLVNIFFRNMIRLNKYHYDCQCLKIKFSLKVQVTGQHVRSFTDLSGQCWILTGHCPLTGRYFKPWHLVCIDFIRSSGTPK